jgi:hypothetical protein
MQFSQYFRSAAEELSRNNRNCLEMEDSHCNPFKFGSIQLNSVADQCISKNSIQLNSIGSLIRFIAVQFFDLLSALQAKCMFCVKHCNVMLAFISCHKNLPNASYRESLKVSE